MNRILVNGGTKQPGCDGLYNGIQDNLAGWLICSHLYSEYIFRDSIKELIFGCPCPIPDIGIGKLPPCMKTCEGAVRMGYYLEESRYELNKFV